MNAQDAAGAAARHEHEAERHTAEAARQAQLADLIDAYYDAIEAIDKHETTKRDVADRLVELLGVGGRAYSHPGIGVAVSAPARRFNPARAREVLTPELYASICLAVPDVHQAEALLPGALLDRCKVAGHNATLRKVS